MPAVMMKKGSKRIWRIAPKDGTTAAPIAEPKHRSGAVGLSSGLSLRQFPKSTVQKVRDICEHYVGKCSGKYENNKVAARYVYQMADEVISQLSGVAAQIREAHNSQPDNLQDLLNEWTQHFPPSLGALGAPKTVAAILQKQTQELEQLRSERELERSDRAQEIADVMKSVNIQLHASCEGVMSERRQLTFVQQQQMADFEMQAQSARAESNAKLENLRATYDAKIQRLQDAHQKQYMEASSLATRLKAELSADKLAHTAEKAEADRIRKSENEDYSSHIQRLKKQVLSVQGVVSAPTSPSSPGRDSSSSDNISVVSLQFDEEANRKRKKSLKLTGTVAKAVKQLKEKLGEMSLRCDENSKVIDTLLVQIDATYKERDLYKRRMEESESINEALRKALSMRLYNEYDNTGIRGARTIKI